MSTTTFSGPVVSQNGFQGAVSATTVNASGAVVLSNAVVSLTALPTSDPGVAGRLWNDAGTLKVSAGA